MKSLDGKVALVTGGGSGIGQEVCYKLAAAGAKVVVSDINEQAAHQTVGYIEDHRGSAVFVKSNSGIAHDNEFLVDETVRRFGALHIAVNNAGIGGPNLRTGEYPIEGWDKVISINLSGVFYGMRYQIPAMLKAGGGSIINMSSILGKVGFAQSPAYAASKHGVIGLTESAAIEYASQNIRVNAVCPGFIKTPLLEKSLDEDAKKALVGLHPIGRLGESREIADVVLWLSSDKASFVTGTSIVVDGGYLAK